MRRWRCQSARIISAPFRSYPHEVRGPLATNKQLLAGLRKIKRKSRAGEKDKKGDDGDHAAEGWVETPSVQTDLPQSPLMFKYTERGLPPWKIRKPQQERAELSPFQEQLQANVYARALASPVRMCKVTNARLPNDFLLEYGLSTHPDTGKKWIMPKLAGKLSRSRKDRAQDKSLDEEVANGAVKPRPEPSQHMRTRTLSGLHVLSSYAAVDLISGGYASKHHREVIPQTWKEGKDMKKGSLVWREDMADFTLGLLRKEMIQLMERFFATGQAKDMIPCESLADVRAEESVSMILCLSSNDDSHEGISEVLHHSSASEAIDNGSSWVAIEHNGVQVPVLFMDALLGSDLLATVRDEWPNSLGTNFAVFSKGEKTVKIQAKLWKLAGFAG